MTVASVPVGRAIQYTSDGNLISCYVTKRDSIVEFDLATHGSAKRAILRGRDGLMDIGHPQ